jgi:hypothetical protein
MTATHGRADSVEDSLDPFAEHQPRKHTVRLAESLGARPLGVYPWWHHPSRALGWGPKAEVLCSLHTRQGLEKLIEPSVEFAIFLVKSARHAR